MSTRWNENLKRPKRNTTDWAKTKWFPFVATGVLAMVVGGFIGASGQPEPIVKEVPGPERVVTNTVEKKVDVPVTPAACVTALDLSEKGFSISAEAMGYMSDALTAASKFDVASMQRANVNLDALNPKLKAITAPMKAASAECRAAAK